VKGDRVRRALGGHASVARFAFRVWRSTRLCGGRYAAHARVRSGAGCFSAADFGEPANLELPGIATPGSSRLEAVEVGDGSDVEWYDSRRGGLRSRSYRVTTIAWWRLRCELLRRHLDDTLTLVTCYPFDAARALRWLHNPRITLSLAGLTPDSLNQARYRP